MMRRQQVYWKRLVVKTATWLLSEVMINCAGLDDLAAYSEFLFERDVFLEAATPSITLVQAQF